jgi:hypothetical protein
MILPTLHNLALMLKEYPDTTWVDYKDESWIYRTPKDALVDIERRLEGKDGTHAAVMIHYMSDARKTFVWDTMNDELGEI